MQTKSSSRTGSVHTNSLHDIQPLSIAKKQYFTVYKLFPWFSRNFYQKTMYIWLLSSYREFVLLSTKHQNLIHLLKKSVYSFLLLLPLCGMPFPMRFVCSLLLPLSERSLTSTSSSRHTHLVLISSCLLSTANSQRPWLGDNKRPSVFKSVHPFISFYINLNVLFIHDRYLHQICRDCLCL